MSKKISKFEDFIYSKFLDLDYDLYAKKKQYEFKTGIDLSLEFSNMFFKIMNFIHFIISRSYHEKQLLKLIHNQETQDIASYYNENYGLISNNINKIDFIAFISKHAATEGKKNILTMFNICKNVAYTHALLCEKIRCVNYLQQNMSISNIKDILLIDLNNSQVIEILFKLNCNMSIKHILKIDTNNILKDIIVPQFLNSSINLEIMKKIIKKYDIVLSPKDCINLCKIHSIKKNDNEAKYVLSLSGLILYHESYTVQRNTFIDVNLLYNSKILSNLNIWEVIYKNCDKNKINNYITYKILKSCVQDYNILHALYYCYSTIYGYSILQECTLSSKECKKIYNIINKINKIKLYCNHSKLLNKIEPLCNDDIKTIINESRTVYTNYTNIICRYTDYDIGKFVIQYLHLKSG